MNCYECTFITKQGLSDSQAKNLIGKYEKIIKTNSGEVLKTEEWGLRILSHRIKNNKKGFYFHIKFKGVGQTIKELEKIENIDETLTNLQGVEKSFKAGELILIQLSLFVSVFLGIGIFFILYEVCLHYFKVLRFTRFTRFIIQN